MTTRSILLEKVLDLIEHTASHLGDLGWDAERIARACGGHYSGNTPEEKLLEKSVKNLTDLYKQMKSNDVFYTSLDVFFQANGWVQFIVDSTTTNVVVTINGEEIKFPPLRLPHKKTRGNKRRH